MLPEFRFEADGDAVPNETIRAEGAIPFQLRCFLGS